jgi:hypothetical protein
MTDTYNPADYTVDQVNEFLDANPDQTDAVLAAEADEANGGKARVGILEGPHAPDQPDSGPESQDLVAAAQEAGFHGTAPGAGEVKPADQSAPDDVASLKDSTYGADPVAKTLNSMKLENQTQPSNLRQTEDVRQGYVGTLPKGVDRDLSVADVVAKSQAARADSTE